MSVARKMFLGYAALLVLMGGLLTFGSYWAVTHLMTAVIHRTQETIMDGAVAELAAMYTPERQWEQLKAADLSGLERNAGVLIRDSEGRTVASFGDIGDMALESFGVSRTLTTSDGQSWTLLYVNSAIHVVAMLRYGSRDMLVILLVLGLVLLLAIGLPLTYWLARRLTTPIRAMLPAIDQLGKGDMEARVQIATKDEYAAVSAALNDMAAKLQQAEQWRKQMTADVAHELRTPLTIVTGQLDYWQQSMKSIEPEQLLPLQDELIRLQRLVADLQSLSKAEAGQLALQLTESDAGELLARLVEKLAVEAEEKEIELSLDVEPPKLAVTIDYARMTQVLLNLIMNAIRYTPRGGKVRVTAAAEEAGICIRIADNGIGIEPEHLPYLFQRFYRTERARSRDGGGSGLGLAIAREFVRAHRGSLEVESEVGRGTTFTLRLPYGNVAEAQSGSVRR